MQEIWVNKYEFLNKKRENIGIKHLNNPNAFIECSNSMDDVYEVINDYNPSRKRKKLIVFWWHDCQYYDKKKISSHNQRIVY